MDGNQVNIFDLGLAEEEIDDLFKCFYDYDFANASINDSDETCTSASVKEVPAESSEMRFYANEGEERAKASQRLRGKPCCLHCGLNVSITPYKIDFFVDMTYWLDNDHRIYRMDMKSVAFEEFEADKLFQ
eukprot:gene2839-3097_t